MRAYESSLAPIFPEGLAMLAVGGFGRRELFPYSDMDIMLVLERESQTSALKDALSEFVRLMWDAGLRLSHSVRTIAECCEIHDANIELNVSLLERRPAERARRSVCRTRHQIAAVEERQARSLSRHLCKLARSRHEKYNDTLYHLEPDVKEPPGGLRDLHLIGWLEKLRKTSPKSDTRLERPRAFSTRFGVSCIIRRTGPEFVELYEQEEVSEQFSVSGRERRRVGGLMREYFRERPRDP